MRDELGDGRVLRDHELFRRAKELVSRELPPDYLVTLEEEFQRLLGLLRDDQLRRFVMLKLEGYTNQEISEQMEISPASVSRKNRLIRDTWSREMER